MCEVPTLREELDRKTVEALAEMTLSHDKGMMSQEAYYQSLLAINLVTNGLIDDEVSLVISDNLKNNMPSYTERRVFISAAATIVIARPLGADHFEMTKIVSGSKEQKVTPKSFEAHDDSIKACSVAIEKLVQQLIDRGFTEVN